MRQSHPHHSVKPPIASTHRWISFTLKHLMQPLFATVLLAACLTTQARTITIEDTKITHIAHIGPELPQASWIGSNASQGVYTTNVIDMTPGRRLLIQYPLGQIPNGQRIVSAQWIIPVTHAPFDSHRLFVWRLLQPWGLGVNLTQRTQVPKPVPWSSPGADAPGVDRAITPTATIRISGVQEYVIDVTQDVELWYTGVAPNYGWVMALDEGNRLVRLASPLYSTPSVFTLRITYEPE